jgi:hypothetical protein
MRSASDVARKGTCSPIVQSLAALLEEAEAEVEGNKAYTYSDYFYSFTYFNDTQQRP